MNLKVWHCKELKFIWAYSFFTCDIVASMVFWLKGGDFTANDFQIYNHIETISTLQCKQTLFRFVNFASVFLNTVYD